jgi:hypothetical protein
MEGHVEIFIMSRPARSAASRSKKQGQSLDHQPIPQRSHFSKFGIDEQLFSQQRSEEP